MPTYKMHIIKLKQGQKSWVRFAHGYFQTGTPENGKTVMTVLNNTNLCHTILNGCSCQKKPVPALVAKENLPAHTV